jgi:hypothetical protein
MEPLKILTKRHEADNQLTKLEGCLQTLLLIAERGDWDNIGDFSDHLLLALEAVSKPNFLMEAGISDKRRIELTIVQLQVAIDCCVTRKEQIAPLVNALVPAKVNSSSS